MSFLDPSGVHVGDTFDGDVLDNERIIANCGKTHVTHQPNRTEQEEPCPTPPC